MPLHLKNLVFATAAAGAILCPNFEARAQAAVDTTALVRSAPTVRAPDRFADGSPRRAPLGPRAGGAGLQQSAVLPPFSQALLAELKRQDAASNQKRLRIGLVRALDQPINVNRYTAPAAQWTTLPDGWRIWSVDVTSQGALGIRLHLESLVLPPGASILVYDPANLARDSAVITAEALSGGEGVWTETVFAERAVLECDLPPAVDPGSVAFSITELSHMYRSLVTGFEPRAETCENDVTCFPDWAQQAAAVARIQFMDSGQQYLCTGCLLNHNDTNVVADYFLTANHCVENQTVASTVQFFWLYQTTNCDLPDTAPDFSTMPYTQGSTLLATAAVPPGNDFTLLQLSQAPPNGVFYAGWTTALPSASETVAIIHHPGQPADPGQTPTDYTRISFGHEVGTGNLDALTGGSGPGDTTNNAWQLQWFSGVTEEGSSGSPLFDANQLVIGQLYGGESDCTNQTGIDLFGRFDVTYNSVRQWLDPLTGTYTGLFYDTNGVAQGSSGLLTLTVTTRSSYSGMLQLGSARYPLSGQFNASGSASQTISRRGANPLTVNMALDLSGATPPLTGTVSDGQFVAQLAANRSVFGAQINPSPYAGKYTIGITRSSGGETVPLGFGYGALSVTIAGKVSLTGALADGTPLSQSTIVSVNGQWPLYVSLYRGQGLVLGWMTFDSNQPPATLQGSLSWIRPAMPAAKLFPAGFSLTNIMVAGSRYTPPPTRATPVINLSTGLVDFAGGNLSVPFTNLVTLKTNNMIANNSNNRLNLTLVLSSGLFNGTVTVPGGKQVFPFHGALLQNADAGLGYFLGPTQGGAVFLAP